VKQLRIPAAAMMAAVVTLSLFLLMHRLVSSGSANLPEFEEISGIHFGLIDIPREIASRNRRESDQPPISAEPPPIPRLQVPKQEQPAQNMPQTAMPNLEMSPLAGPDVFPGNFLPANQTEEGDIRPLVVIRPMYPREAAVSGIEGWVKVELTVTETGTVKNPRVIEAEPARIFNREAIRAILEWKFKPRIVGGIATERQVTQVIEFSLDDAENN